MGFVAALLSKTGADVSKSLLQMLIDASPCQGDGYGVSTPDAVSVSPSLNCISLPRSHVMLGHKLVKTKTYDQPQPTTQDGYTLIFEGRIWDTPPTSDLSTITDLVGPSPERGIRNLIKEKNGSFAIVTADSRRILCGKDRIGVIPLYIGEASNIVGASSNRKMLWNLGIKAKHLPPGCVAEMTSRGISTHRIKILQDVPVQKTSMSNALKALDQRLLEAVKFRTQGVYHASLGFSGGIDSVLIAHYLNKCGVDVDLVCVGLEGSKDFVVAESAAESLGLPIKLKTFSIHDVETDLEAVMSSVEEPDPMKVSVAMPIYWAIRARPHKNSRFFYLGNGSDELFGGYSKYVREYAASGKNVKNLMFKDVKSSYKVNFNRDYKVCADNCVELRLPFADQKLIDFSLSLPLKFKISTKGDSLRKLVLRSLLKNIGLPDSITSRPKKAVQYSTGVNKTLRRLAKNERKSLSRFLVDRFELIRKNYSGKWNVKAETGSEY